MSSSSDDDLPLAARPGASALVGLGASVSMGNPSISDSSPAPSWLTEYKSPTKGLPALDLSSDSDSGIPALGASQEVGSPAAVVDLEKPTTGGPGRGVQPSAPRQLPPTTATPQALPTATLPLLLPDRLPTNKLLLELGPVKGRAGNMRATDLSGDSGAIGRLNLVGPKDARRLQIDLKGVLYDADLVPCPMTLGILNVGAAEARVECLFQECIQMREDLRHAAGETGPANLFADEDDEEGQQEGPGEGLASQGTKVAHVKGESIPGGRRKSGVKTGGAARQGKPRNKPAPKPKPRAARGVTKKTGKTTRK